MMITMNQFTIVFLACLLAKSAIAADALPRWVITLSDESRIAFVPQENVLGK